MSCHVRGQRESPWHPGCPHSPSVLHPSRDLHGTTGGSGKTRAQDLPSHHIWWNQPEKASPPPPHCLWESVGVSQTPCTLRLPVWIWPWAHVWLGFLELPSALPLKAGVSASFIEDMTGSQEQSGLHTGYTCRVAGWARLVLKVTPQHKSTLSPCLTAGPLQNSHPVYWHTSLVEQGEPLLITWVKPLNVGRN